MQPGHILFCVSKNVENELRPGTSKCQLNRQWGRSTPELCAWCNKCPVTAENVEIIMLFTICCSLIVTTFAFSSSFLSMVRAGLSSSSSVLSMVACVSMGLAWASPAHCLLCFIPWCCWGEVLRLRPERPDPALGVAEVCREGRVVASLDPQS